MTESNLTFNDALVFWTNLDHCSMLEVFHGDWCKYPSDDIYWVDKDGVYSAEIRESTSTQNDMFIFNGDTCQSYCMTYIFHRGKELSYEDFEDFEDKYGDQMW